MRAGFCGDFSVKVARPEVVRVGQKLLVGEHATAAAATGANEFRLPGVSRLQNEAVIFVLLEDCQYFVPGHFTAVVAAEDHGGHVTEREACLLAGRLLARLVPHRLVSAANAFKHDERARGVPDHCTDVIVGGDVVFDGDALVDGDGPHLRRFDCEKRHPEAEGFHICARMV